MRTFGTHPSDVHSLRSVAGIIAAAAAERHEHGDYVAVAAARIAAAVTQPSAAHK